MPGPKIKSHQLTIGREPYYGPVLLKVTERDEFGRPTKVEVGYDDSSFRVQDGTEFVTGYVHRSAVANYLKRKGSA